MLSRLFQFNCRKRLLLAMAVTTLAGCLTAQQAETTPGKTGEILILFSGQALGELKPCGCAREEDQGGIERRMGYFLNKQPKDIPFVRVDVGDNFKEPSRQGRLKAGTMAKAMQKMQYDAVVLGEKDLVYGNSLLKELPALPWLSANVTIKDWAVPSYRVKTLSNGLKVGLISVAEPELFYGGRHSNITVESPDKALARNLPELRKENPDIIVLLTHMKKEAALPLLKMKGIDLVINGHIHDDQHLVDFNPVEREGKLFVQPGPRGQKVGELKVTLNADGTKTFSTKIIKLDSKIPSDPGMTALYSEYNDGVESIFMETLKAKRKNKTSVYATDKTCQTCHAETHAKWEQSRHGHAYKTLLQVNKAFDPECLICHTTGFNQTGGFLSAVDTPKLKNVQCEMCHGPQKEHTQSPQGGFAKEARNACGKCHVRNHSPNFSFEKYWPKIKH